MVGGHAGGVELVGRPSRKSRRGWKTLPEVQNWLGDHPGGPKMVGEPSWRSGSGWKTLSEVRNWS